MKALFRLSDEHPLAVSSHGREREGEKEGREGKGEEEMGERERRARKGATLCCFLL